MAETAPRYMTIEEATAWVRYRTDSARSAVKTDPAQLRVLQYCETHDDRPESPVDDVDATAGRLHERLLAGDLIAINPDGGPITHTMWQVLRPWKHEPVPTVLVREDQVLRLWPAIGAPKRGRPPKYDWEKIDRIIEAEISKGGANIPLRIQKECERSDHIKGVPDERTIRDRMRKVAGGK